MCWYLNLVRVYAILRNSARYGQTQLQVCKRKSVSAGVNSRCRPWEKSLYGFSCYIPCTFVTRPRTNFNFLFLSLGSVKLGGASSMWCQTYVADLSKNICVFRFVQLVLVVCLFVVLQNRFIHFHPYDGPEHLVWKVFFVNILQALFSPASCTFSHSLVEHMLHSFLEERLFSELMLSWECPGFFFFETQI